MRFSYPAEKLSEARACLMLPHIEGEEGSIMHAFHACKRGLDDLEGKGADQFLDDSAQDWVKAIKALMSTEGIEDEKGEGTWILKARQLTTDDRLQLSRCVDELAHWFDRYEYSDM